MQILKDSGRITGVMSPEGSNKPKGGAMMAKCAICDKSVHFGNNVSHSHRKTSKMWRSNVKSVNVKVNGGAKKMYVCTSCLKSGKVERA